MWWKVKEATEREKMAEMVIGEYANLVRKLEGRLPNGTGAGAALEVGLSQGKLGLKRLVGEMEEEISALQVQVQALQVEKEAVEGRVEALTKATEVDRAAKAQAEFELEKMKVDDKTAAKMVSRYMYVPTISARRAPTKPPLGSSPKPKRTPSKPPYHLSKPGIQRPSQRCIPRSTISQTSYKLPRHLYRDSRTPWKS
jgi:hypothetical protein